ncbi:cysteine-rich receptor-like protein kinase 10 [Prosopis cineraria]|uniref:cysteine-rich receptor-like protein kinase 10 n=1 Tax=Prosopis cineraria TaxID=364024 RepID=UPI00240F45B7|nr:cysteine-rich receptor-like protein kinase 10 [Prosopis cineraria]
MAGVSETNRIITITNSSFNLILLLMFLCFLCSPISEAAEAPIFLRQNCTGTETFAQNSTFHFNLRTLLDSLASHATGHIQFFNNTVTTAAVRNHSDTVYGLFMCRGDVPQDLCEECVFNATHRFGASSGTCPFSKGAILWYDECMVRYSNQYFFSKMETRPRMRLRNIGNVTDNVKERYMRLMYTTLNETADKAAKAPIGVEKYATKTSNLSAFQTLYCLTQCTPDLSPQDCRKCLSLVIEDVAWCCTYRIGGRVLYPSCNFRYELYPFYRQQASVAPTLAPPALVNSTPSSEDKGKSGKSSGTVVATVVSITVAVLLFIVGVCFLSKRTRKEYDTVADGNSANDIATLDSLQYDFSTIEAATNKFSADNKLGEGGFGEVYRGMLPNGQEIAVKRLSQGSGQGGEEFKNEAMVVAKLQHRNLVRFLGFSLQGQEKILIYEYMQNKSLDYIIFDHEKQRQLNWRQRYEIIKGIVRGIQYLHEDSKFKIIHRDLKANNILLDSDMNPKISDFGIARIFSIDQTQGNTSRIIGTYGYVSPEYAMHGKFSVKSDVYSFGVLLMEIISGKKNSSFHQTDGAVDLLSHAWKLWKDETPLELLDPTLIESYTPNEVIRCIHIGLLCVQEDPTDRPTMASIALMLDSYSVTLPTPLQPEFFVPSYN